jgi:hypothetical protein
VSYAALIKKLGRVSKFKTFRKTVRHCARGSGSARPCFMRIYFPRYLVLVTGKDSFNFQIRRSAEKVESEPIFALPKSRDVFRSNFGRDTEQTHKVHKVLLLSLFKNTK